MDAYGLAYSNGLAQEEGEDYSETPEEDYGDELFESYEMTNNDIQQFKVDNATEKKNTKDSSHSKQETPGEDYGDDYSETEPVGNYMVEVESYEWYKLPGPFTEQNKYKQNKQIKFGGTTSPKPAAIERDNEERMLYEKREETTQQQITSRPKAISEDELSKPHEITTSKNLPLTTSTRPQMTTSIKPQVKSSRKPKLTTSEKPQMTTSKKPRSVNNAFTKKKKEKCPPHKRKSLDYYDGYHYRDEKQEDLLIQAGTAADPEVILNMSHFYQNT